VVTNTSCDCEGPSEDKKVKQTASNVAAREEADCKQFFKETSS